jgi:hypothetical protein
MLLLLLEATIARLAAFMTMMMMNLWSWMSGTV